jgi:hypothetical protein
LYDALTSRYAFSCPVKGETSVTLSAFRSLEALAGTSHPVVYRVTFACVCGDEHPGLVTHDELDWAPLGFGGDRFFNLMTARLEDLSLELSDLAARRIAAGAWPWTFFCLPEERPRPVFPSSFFLLAAADQTVGVAVRCPVCTRTSVNLVTRSHLDVPFHNDAEIGVVRHLFPEEPIVEEFRAFLDSSDFDGRRLAL